MKKPDLGRGLESLLGSRVELLDREQSKHARDLPYKTLPVAELHPSKNQARQHFDAEALSELEASIRAQGVLQPLLVRPHEGGYEIIAGERRWRAAQQAGLDVVPCMVHDFNDRQAAIAGLIENLQRSDLNPLEVAQGFRTLIEEYQLTHETVAEAVGYSRASVSNVMRLLELSQPIKDALQENIINMGHARALLALKDPSQQQQVLQYIIAGGWTVRKTEAFIRRMNNPPKVKKTEHADVSRLQERLSESFGLSAQIKTGRGGRGKIILSYRNLDELEALLKQWGITPD